MAKKKLYRVTNIPMTAFYVVADNVSQAEAKVKRIVRKKTGIFVKRSKGLKPHRSDFKMADVPGGVYI